jgi:hypothetical protein
MKKWLLTNRLYFIGATIGAFGGFLYWKYVGCLTGTCAITANSFRSTIYFAVFGGLIIGSFKKQSKIAEPAKQQ